MQKMKKRKHVQKSPIAVLKAAQSLAVHTESYFPSTLCLESSAPFFVALRLAHIEAQAQIALRQLTALAALTFASSRLFATLCPQQAVLTLSTDSNQKPCRDTGLTMYHHHHHHQQQQGAQSFPSGPPPNQPPVHPSADMMPPPVGPYQFPRPTQLPDELESALSIRGSRDMDHRLIEHLDRLSQLQNQAAASAMGQHGNYGTSPQAKQQPVDWPNYDPPTKLYSGHPSSAARPAELGAGHAGTSLPNWNPSVGESSSPNQRGPVGRSFYTPESAGTILASFGLSNEDLEALSHYPDDQLTPDTLPFILRDLQVHKTGKPKTAPSRSPEVPSLLAVTQTEGRVIDYGHASHVKDENIPQKTFKKEPISSERTVKMYPTPAPKLEASVGRQVRLEPAEPIKHGDRDYRRRSSEHHTSRSPPRDFSTKQRHQDRDYRTEPPKPRASAEKRSAEPPVSKQRPLPKPARTVVKVATGKKLPTPTMINDFSGLPPKVYPHTCSLCEMQCDQEKDWVGHLETVNHTAACRHLRSKYPNWKPKVSSREYGGRTADHKRHAAGHSRSTSWSPPPPSDKPRGAAYKPRGKAYAPHHVPRHNPYSKDVDGRFERPHSHGEPNIRRPFKEHWDKREQHEGPSRMYLKRPHYDSKHFKSLKGEQMTKKTLLKSKSALKTDNKHGEEGPPAKKKKVVAPVVASGPECLVYLTDIPKEATEQEVLNLAGSFGPINNVLMMPFPDEEEQKDQCQQASVCMLKAEDAQTFANAPNLLIRNRVITASVAKIPEEGLSSEAYGSSKAETDGAGADLVPEKKGVVLIEDLPESGWTEEDLRALAEPFGYLDDIIAAKQIQKALLLFPDTASAGEMEKVHAFSPLTINGHRLSIKHFIRSISINTPVALYNCFMQSVKPKGTSWTMLLIVSNVPQTPSAASVVHKLVSRIGTVFRSLAINNMVICEMANGPLGTAVYKHYLKFPCMIQNNPLVFSRKPDPKSASKVIPAFLDADKDVAENKTEVEMTPQNETGAEPTAREQTQPDVEVKVEPAETEVTTKEEAKETEEQVSEEAEPAEMKPEDVKTEDAQKETANEPTVEEAEGASPKENGTHVQPTEEATTAPTKTDGEASAPETATEVKEPKADPDEPKPQVKPSKKPPAPGKKRASAEPNKEPSKSSGREEERRRAEKERRDKESRDQETRERERETRERERETREREREKEREQRERERETREREREMRERERERERETRERERRERDRVRKEREHEERSKRDNERDRRDWRRDGERRDGRRNPYEEGERRRGDSSKRSQHREERYRSSSRRSATEEDDFPFNLSEFVTVDEVGDVDSDAPIPDAPSETEVETQAEVHTEGEVQTEDRGQESEPQEREADVETPMEVEPEEAEKETEEEVTEANAEEEEVTEANAEEEEVTEANAEEEEVTEANAEEEEVSEANAEEEEVSEANAKEEEVSEANAEEEEVTEANTEEEEPTSETETKDAEVAEVNEEEQTSAGDDSEVTEEPCPAAAEETNQEEPNPPQDDGPKASAVTTDETEEKMEEEVKEEAPAAEKDAASSEKLQTEIKTTTAPPAAQPKKSENGNKDVEEKPQSGASNNVLPPFNPNNSVGLEYLVPMTGFFCKVCSRFFTGAKDTQLSHSKTLKHYENLQKFLKSRQSSASSAAST